MGQIFVAFSEYPNFTNESHKKSYQTHNVFLMAELELTKSCCLMGQNDISCSVLVENTVLIPEELHKKR